VAPDLELPTLGGGKARLSGYRGRAVLLVMFLSGCHICEREIGQVERLHRQYLQKGLTVVGVAVDKEETSVRSFVERHSITFIVLLDPDAAAVRAAYESWKMPEAYLIDAGGTVQDVFLGSVRWRTPETRERIERLLPAPKASPGPS
jgi:peroxiredoxin